jgi:uncharacterized membrane protein YraQ (UPF0718 family)
MRIIFGLVSLLIVVAIVGILTKKQLSAVTQLPNTASTTTPTTAGSTAAPGNIAEQSKQIQTQVKDQMNEALKAAAEARDKALDGGNADKPVDKTGSAY